MAIVSGATLPGSVKNLSLTATGVGGSFGMYSNLRQEKKRIKAAQSKSKGIKNLLMVKVYGFLKKQLAL